MDEALLKFLRKARTMTLSTNGEKLWATKVFYALDEGFVFLVEKGSLTLKNIEKNPKVSFEIDSNKLKLFVQGTGTVQILGEPSDFPKERGILIYKIPEDQVFIKHEHVLIARMIPEEIVVMDMRVEMKKYSEKVSLDEMKQKINPLTRAMRPWSFQQSVITFVAGAILAGQLHSLYFLLGISGVVIAHAAFNMLSEYFDYKTGLDTPKSMGGSRVLVDNLTSGNRVLNSALILIILSVLIALFFIIIRPVIIPYVVIGLVAGLLYGVPRIGFKNYAMGDLAVFLAWGPGIFLGSYALMGGKLNLPVILVSVTFALLTVNILHGNNWRDIKDDTEKGIITVASLLGNSGSKAYYFILLWLPFVILILASLINYRFFPSLMALVTVPLAINLTVVAKNDRNINRGMLDKLTAQYTLIYGIVIVLAFIILQHYSLGLKLLFP